MPPTPNAAGHLFVSPALKLNEQANAWRSVVESSTAIGNNACGKFRPMPLRAPKLLEERSGQHFKIGASRNY
jgi:hypothetical protein